MPNNQRDVTMTDTFTDNGALVNWSIPQCPFLIEYSRKALDDIRLAVVDAFFSLPRGGAEIGGILLGRFEAQRLRILDYAPLECEHAFGPAFTLSPTDQTRLGEMLRQTYPGGLRPVGWYHSHTRSEISLCEADLDIHNRYFPEAWQVALVLRPSTLQPTQAGFFFREPDGSLRAQSSYQEFVLEALPLQPARLPGPEAVPGPMREAEADAVVLTLHSSEDAAAPADFTESAQPSALLMPAAAELPVAFPEEPEAAVPPEHSTPQSEHETAFAWEPSPESDSAPEPEAPVLAPIGQSEAAAPESDTPVERPRWEEHEPEPTREPADYTPRFAMDPEKSGPSPRRWIGMVGGLAAGLVIGLFAGQARSHSQPPAAAAPAPVIAPRPASVASAPAPEDAALRKKNDELSRQIADLSQQNADLRKQSADLSSQQTALRKQNTDLTTQQASLSKQEAELSKQQGEAGIHQAELRQQRDDLIKQTARLKTDLTAQTARAQALQQQVDDLRKQQQRRRLSVQSGDPQP
jgi:proteasome lid subunit RPN8/RPN11